MWRAVFMSGREGLHVSDMKRSKKNISLAYIFPYR